MVQSDPVFNSSYDKSGIKTENLSNLGALMKVITKQPAKLPLPHTQASSILDGGYLKMINDGRKSLKCNKSGFVHSGSTSSIFTCGNPNMNLMAFNDL